VRPSESVSYAGFGYEPQFMRRRTCPSCNHSVSHLELSGPSSSYSLVIIRRTRFIEMYLVQSMQPIWTAESPELYRFVDRLGGTCLFGMNRFLKVRAFSRVRSQGLWSRIVSRASLQHYRWFTTSTSHVQSNINSPN